MDSLILVGFFVVTLVAPAVLAFALRRTPAWWVPGVALAGFGAYLLIPADHHDYRGEGSGGAGYYAGVGDLVGRIYGICLVIYAAYLFMGARASRRAARQPPKLPPAKAM